MMKRLASAAALTLIFAGAAFAQAPPADNQPPQAAAETVAPSTPAAAADAAAPAPAETGSITQPQEATPGAARTEAGAAAEAASAAPSTVESCIAAAVDLGSTAESKSLTGENADRLDALFSKMETLCDGEQFAEAKSVADDIRSIISAN